MSSRGENQLNGLQGSLSKTQTLTVLARMGDYLADFLTKIKYFDVSMLLERYRWGELVSIIRQEKERGTEGKPYWDAFKAAALALVSDASP